MKIKLLLIMLLLLTSCTTIKKSYVNAPIGVSTTVELDADVILGTKISGFASETRLFGLLKISGLFKSSKYADNIFGGLKSQAAYNALQGSDADVIVNPQYVYEVNNLLLFQTIKCTVTGTAGKIKVQN